jgi:flagellar biosynthesis/type III secretory pathway M-ring protein FliF/YscJ
MSKDLIKDSAEAISQAAVKKTEIPILEESNTWIWFSIIGFTIFFVLILFLLKRKSNKNITRNQFKEDSLKGEIDYNNIFESSFHGKELYDELKKKCHPDRFPNDPIKNKIALELAQEISENKNNYKKLIELKEIVKSKLGLTF